MTATDSAPDAFHLQVRQSGSVQLVELSGVAGMEHAEDLQEQLQALGSDPQPLIVLDLSGLHFVNSAGLGAFIALYRRVNQGGGRLCFAQPRDAVAQILRVTNLDRLVPVFESVPAAVEALTGTPQPPPTLGSA